MSANPQILNVLGEQVSLEPTTFDPSEKFLVSFDEKYKVPGMTDAEVAALKAILGKLFSGTGVLSTLFTAKAKQPPLPPCTKEEKDLLLKSLTHRFGSLRNELIAERQSQSDSLRLRQITDQLQRLKQYIDFAKQSTACEQLDEGVLAETIGDLTDEQIYQLLRQFIFFVLQGQHPLADFRGRDPNPKGFVARLSKTPLTDFDHFLDEYRQAKHPVPLPIEKVLQVTKAGVNAMERELKDSLQDKVRTIVASLATTFPPESPFWLNLDTSNLDAIIDRLAEFITTLQEDLEDCEQQSRQDQSHIVTLDTEREHLEQELAALRAKLQIAEATQASFEEDSLANSTGEMDALREQMQQSIDALKQQIQYLEQEEYDLATRLEEAENQIVQRNEEIAEKEQALQRCKVLEEDNAKLLKTVGTYQERLLEAKQKLKDCEEIETRAKTLEKTLATRETELAELRKAAGPLTQEIDTHLREKAQLQLEKEALEEELNEYKSALDATQRFLDALEQDRAILVDMLGSIQRQRASLVPESDEILQRMNSLRKTLEEEEVSPPTVAGQVTELLQDLQAEVAEKQAALDTLASQIQEKDAQIEAAKEAMNQSNALLQQIRAGRTTLNGKGIKYETDKEFLEAAVKAVEAEQDLARIKEELEATLAQMQAKSESLQADMVALQARFENEVATLKEAVEAGKEDLSTEREKTASLQGIVAKQGSDLEGLQEALARKEEEVQQAKDQLQQERNDTATRIASLQEASLRDCDEKLKALRAEEEAKRQALLSAQGAEKGTLQGKLNELLTQITGVKGQRDALQAELEVEQGKLQLIEANLETLASDYKTAVADLNQKIRVLQTEKSTAVGEAATLKEQVRSLGSELEDLRQQVLDDSAEKAKVYEAISKLSTWIASGARDERPAFDDKLNQKYGIHRIVDSFLDVLPKEEEVTDDPSDMVSSAMSRCYLVFFMTYVYARHFPQRQDGDSSYQSQIVALLKGILTEVYRQLEVGIPGKLEPVGSGGIPVQLKSKYLMQILMPLIKQMELVHESGKKGADFLKYSLLDQDQLKTLHMIHRVVLDKLKVSPKDILKTLNAYVLRKTGNVDDDIGNLVLRFFHESKSNKEFPVIVYQSPDAKEMPKFTFGTEIDFTQYLASPAPKSLAQQAKVGSPLDKQLQTNPVFSFNLMFYLFLFVVKDYLSSIEGELDKAGCPIPPILKHR